MGDRVECTKIINTQPENESMVEVNVPQGKRKDGRLIVGGREYKSHQDLIGGTADCKKCYDQTIYFGVASEPLPRLTAHPCPICNDKDEWARLSVICSEITKKNLNPINPYPVWKSIPGIPDHFKEYMQQFFDDCKKPSVKTIVSDNDLKAVEKEFALNHPFKENDKEKWSYPHIISRNAIFRVASTKERAKYQAEESVNDRIFRYDLPYPYSPRAGWHGEIILQTGPLLDTYDERIFLALLKIHHSENGFVGDSLSTSLREITRIIGVSGGKLNLESVKKSLSRLSRTTLQISMPKGITWTESLISGGYKESSGQVVVKFNSHMLVHYKRHAYTVFSLPDGISLSGYAQRVYLFLASHQSFEKEISLKRWREILDVSKALPTTKFNQVMRNTVAELIKLKLLKPESNIENFTLKTIINRQVISLL